jgi:hypothetical protein
MDIGAAYTRCKKYSQARPNPAIQQQFYKHIQDIETVFHPDKTGEFARLWPELTA